MRTALKSRLQQHEKNKLFAFISTTSPIFMVHHFTLFVLAAFARPGCVPCCLLPTSFRLASPDADSSTNVLTLFRSSDIKPLASIRYRTLGGNDVVDVLKSVMKKSPELITDDLPNWLASHGFDRMSRFSNPAAREEAFKYLIYFATQSVPEKALTIVEKNEHYIMAYKGVPTVMCCNSQNFFPHDLFDKINILLVLVKARKALINDLAILLTILVDMILDYAPN